LPPPFPNLRCRCCAPSKRNCAWTTRRLSTKFGDGYPKLAELGNEMAQVDSAIGTELKNLAQRYKNEYLAAADTEKMLRAKVEEQKQKPSTLNQGAAQYAF